LVFVLVPGVKLAPSGSERADHAGIYADFGAELREFNGEAIHAHLLVNVPLTIAISRLVNSLKGQSSRRLRPEVPGPRTHYLRAKRRWPGSHFAGSAGSGPIRVSR
jgi:putative transposase